MSKISLIILLLLQAGTSFAQRYFVFIGTEGRQPFYVRVNSEFHSSSAEGHLILAQLKDTTYSITMGFPGQTLPEQHYSFSINGKDHAFELRSRGQEGQRLYDLQGNQWLSPQGGGGASDISGSSGIKKDDAFSRMMAGVVHDTAVLYNTYAMERALSDSPATAAVKTDPATTTAITGTAVSPAVDKTANPTDSGALATKPSTDSSAAAPPTTLLPATPPPTTPLPADTTAMLSHANRPADTTIASTAPIETVTHIADTTATRAAGALSHGAAPRFNDSGAAPLYRPIPKDTGAAAPIPSSVGTPLYRPATGVVKVSERHGTKNVRLVYADHSAGSKADTIVVVIPVDTPAGKIASHTPHPADSSRAPASRAHGPNADSPIASIGSPAYRPATTTTPPGEAPRPHPADTSRRPTKTTPFVNSDCHDFATDFDVDKLRVKMLESPKDDDRIALARKTFKSKCFFTRQIRALSEVFTSDAAKFRFFEAAWPYAADENFHELSDLLADPVYNSKFKTMTHQQ